MTNLITNLSSPTWTRISKVQPVWSLWLRFPQRHLRSRRDYQCMINPHPRKLSDRSVFTPYWAEPVTQNKNHNKAPSPPPPPPPVDCPPGPPAPLRATQTCRTRSLRSPWTWRCPGVTSSTQTRSPTRTSVNSVIASIAVWNFALTLWHTPNNFPVFVR